MSGEFFLPVSFIKCYRAGHGNVQGTDHANLWNHKIAIRELASFRAYSVFFIAKNQSQRAGEIHIVKTDRLSAQPGCENLIVMVSDLFKALFRVLKAVNSQPFIGTGGGADAPFFVCRQLGVDDVDLLNANGVTTAHYRGYIMGIVYVFHYYGYIGLSFT